MATFAFTVGIYTLMNVVFSCYFCSRKDPQRKVTWKANSFDVIRTWYNSIHDLNMRGLIFHDKLSPEFVRRYETTKVSFVKCELGPRSLNDERFYIYHNYLSKHPKWLSVFATDISDVVFFRNPFSLFLDVAHRGHRIFSGSEPSIIHMHSRYRQVFGGRFPYKTVLNAGVMGGNRADLLFLWQHMINYFDKLPVKINANMSVYNRVMREQFLGKIFTGYPLHSKFKAFQSSGDFFIKHK